ncbi:hypothetical protein BGY98DRAFT_1044966, partial [Russula aff. rugulosa BPL654]
ENTPLHSAAYYGDLEMVQVLLESGWTSMPRMSIAHPINYASQMVIAMTLESLD